MRLPENLYKCPDDAWTVPMGIGANLYKCPDDAWTTPMGIGAFAIRFSEPRRPEITAHCYDFARELNDKHSRLRKRYKDLEEGLRFLKVR